MPDNKESEYAVGYGRPPRRSQFRKGRSGNPKGRPRDSRNLAQVLAEALEEKVAIVENGKRRKITKRDVMIKQLVNKAAAGDLRACRQLTDLEFRLNPEGVRQASVVELFRSIAEKVRKVDEERALEQARLKELENVGAPSSESELAADVGEWPRRS